MSYEPNVKEMTLLERLQYATGEYGAGDALHRAALAALEGVVEVHAPMDALMNPGPRERLVRVCTGCGTDDGNFQIWPCPTARAITQVKVADHE